MKMPFMQAVKERVLVLDGAMGTMLQERGLKAGQSPEEMNLTAPEVVAGVHRAYLEAGADIIVTNTFGGTKAKLEHYGLGDQVARINAEAVRIAREVAGDDAYVAGSIGPTGRFVEPVGDMSFDEAHALFSEQAKALIDAGCDVISLETFLDIKEIRAALIAIRELSADIPVIAMLTFEEKGRSVLGSPPEAAAITLEAAGASIVGSNCGLGVDGIYDILCAMRKVSGLPLISQANAGLPVLKDGVTIFPGTPDEMTAYHDRMIGLGVRVIGGCCGTTPAHISAIKVALSGKQTPFIPREDDGTTWISSRGSFAPIGKKHPVALIGERINPTGKKLYSQELREGKVSYIRREALEQTELGATLLDVNVGTPGIDEPAAMERAVFCVTGAVQTPLVLDSSSVDALEAGLKSADGKVLINSVNGEEKSLAAVLPLARKYGAALVCLTLDDAGIPAEAEGRVAVAQKIAERAAAAGIKRSDLVVDCLTLTVSAEPKGALVALEAVRRVTEIGLNTTLGVSNISFGLPCRPLISSTFFSMVMAAGLTSAIVNVKEAPMMSAWRSAMVLLGKDVNAAGYIDAYRGQSVGATVQPAAAAGAAAPAAEAAGPEGIRGRLAKAVINGELEAVVPLVEEALAEGLSPMQISSEALLVGLDEVGRRFGNGSFFLPQVMVSADTMKAAFARLKQELSSGALESAGKILMATVEGDIHDIGKNILVTLLENNGFEVIDLGKNVPAAKILDAARSHQVDAVGLSALMTTTMAQMDKVVTLLKSEGVKSFTMVGGAVVTQQYADEIGADLYAKDAMEAVARIKELLAK
ncbi:homocysteine S-methyltransferase family protein [Geomonas sp. Red69]|uniref:homocysteine S-methyltransferase family protein n=1 Tax=Geomonas diazotrophica TaxID=2843197 RepID=UPI001C1035A4|nr:MULTISPECIES: homocysteine S-methyltransferase family protein [Geomonas]MBU5635236.1 homocysteine S-methyltransferase family protein [Geomonas diazotrophica]QXE86843.1 homocysteine S-methyltransferase family protein [Geomonas nitrogeniifigens]